MNPDVAFSKLQILFKSTVAKKIPPLSFSVYLISLKIFSYTKFLTSASSSFLSLLTDLLNASNWL